MMKSIKTDDLNWVNNLRLIALFAVIMVHATAPLLEQYNKLPVQVWLIGDFYNSLVRFAVPVFVMITGALLLHREYALGDFLKKRLSRVVVPFLFWSLVYIAYSFYNEELAYSGDSWTTVKQVLHQLKNGSSYHLWYVYMLIGLYFIIPVISKFLRNATENEVLYFLLMWLIVMMIGQPYLARYNPQVDLHYFAGYIGYLVLGHYLAFKQFTYKNLRAIMIMIFFVMLAATTAGTFLLYRHYNGISTLLYEPLSVPMVIISAAIFLIARFTMPTVSPVIICIRNFVSRYNYGIYLGHAFVLTLLDAFDVNYQLFNPILSIPLTAITCFLLTLLLVFIINKIPFGKYVSG